MKKILIHAVCLIAVLAMAVPAGAASANYQVAASNDYTVAGNSVHVTTSGDVTVNFSVSISNASNLTFPVSAVFEVTGPGSDSASLSPAACTFVTSSSSCSMTLTIDDPPANYNISVGPKDGTDSATPRPKPVSMGQTLTIHHHTETAPECAPHTTTLTVSKDCIVYHQPTASITFTLRDADNNGAGVPNAQISYASLAGSGTVTTNSNGVATVTFNTSSLGVGDFTVSGSFAGNCDFAASTGSGSIGVHYNVSPFLQPIPNPINRFKGRVIPVKLSVTDYYNQPVDNAAIYFRYRTSTSCGTGSTDGDLIDGDPLANTNGDSGNLFRYDPTGQIYIFNWDLANVAAGWYQISAYLGESSAAGCASAHTACVQVVK